MPIEAPVHTHYFSASQPFERMPPISNLLLIGDGQLAYLTGRAARRAGLTVGVIGNSPDKSAAQVADVFFEGDIQNDDDLAKVLKFGWTIGLDTEHVATKTLAQIQKQYQTPQILVPVEGLQLTQDKQRQHFELSMADLPFPELLFGISTVEDLERAARDFGYQGVLQTGNAAYDGRGNAVIRRMEDVPGAWKKVGDKGKLFMEKLVPFEEELAVQVVRDASGGIEVAPPVHSLHVNSQLYFAETKMDDRGAGIQDAVEVAKKVSEKVPGTGLLTVELLRLPEEMVGPDQQRVLINEICLGRPHNSHHLTEGALEHSQFDQIVRLARGNGVGSYKFKDGVTYAAMLNLIGARSGGKEIYGIDEVESKTKLVVSWYGKSLGANRKVGHINYAGTDVSEAKDQMAFALELLNSNNDYAFQVHPF